MPRLQICPEPGTGRELGMRGMWQNGTFSGRPVDLFDLRAHRLWKVSSFSLESTYKNLTNSCYHNIFRAMRSRDLKFFYNSYLCAEMKQNQKFVVD